MTTTRWYKTIQMDGSSYHDPDFQYEVGKTVRRRNTGKPVLCTDTVLHAAQTPALAAKYSRWPYRLIEVTGKPVVMESDNGGFKQLTVVAELDVAECYGPHGAVVMALLRRIKSITESEAKQLHAARDAARYAAWVATWDAARDATRVATWDATRDAAGDAAWAYTVTDLIGQHGYTQAQHDLLVGPWETVIGTWNGKEWVK